MFSTCHTKNWPNLSQLPKNKIPLRIGIMIQKRSGPQVENGNIRFTNSRLLKSLQFFQGRKLVLFHDSWAALARFKCGRQP